MKYPQLVSARAVNAISDWLVSRLEQLGVEAPQIYTRLLLSLLQSTVQINDPIEFSNLESFFTNRKGCNKRYLSCDTDTLKKLNAIQCLRDIVSSEQEIVNIENLIEELCEKLKDIEKQIAGNEDEDKLLVATLSLSQHREHQHRTVICNKYQNNSCSYCNANEDSTRIHKNCSSEETTKADLDSDPKKLYFRAFPALSKEMEDSFRIWRHNAKSLTWPVERNNISISNSSSSSTISSSFGSGGSGGALVCGGNGVGVTNKNYIKETVAGEINDSKIEKEYIGVQIDETENFKLSQQLDADCMDAHNGFNISNMTSAVIKRKSKRRRSQAITKGKTTQNIRKSGHSNIGGLSQMVNSSNVSTVGKYNRNTTPTYWDTNFEGCWEMGRDLIKEFILRQNGKNRNRSTSESAAYNMREINKDANLASIKSNGNKNIEKLGDSVAKKKENNGEKVLVDEKWLETRSPLLPNVDISFCDDDYDDTLTSISKLTNNTSLNVMSSAPAKRLYEREMSGIESHEIPTADTEEDTTNSEQLDFAQFEAKFNSNVEALWKDADPSVSINAFGLSESSAQMPSSLPMITPLTENLKNFWANYYNHRFDLNKILPTVQLSSKNSANCNNISFCSLNAGLNINDLTNRSDYFSMPSKLENIDRQVVDIRKNCESGERNTPVALFLQNSIWSENFNVGGGDTDESFYLKVRNSALKMNNLDAEEEIDKRFAETNDNKAFPFPPYNISKWSEGINAGPHIQVQQSQLRKVSKDFRNNGLANVKRNNFSALNLNADCTDSITVKSHSSASNHSSVAAVYNWQTPFNSQSGQNDLESWTTSNPLPLTEIFRTDIEDSVPKTNALKDIAATTHIADFETPVVTLLNHSTISSGFIEYSRIKSEMQILKKDIAKQTLQNYPTQLQRPKERYADDENLLTSERTHFHPIKSYTDGHTFDICSDLDLIQYKRSESGYLYLENEKYLEYIRNDNFMVEDEAVAAVPTAGASANPLYANSNCEAAISRHQYNGTPGIKQNKIQDFVIKFRLQTTEMACQTENELKIVGEGSRHCAKTPQSNELQHPLYLVFSNAAKNMKQSSFNRVCNDTVEAFNRAVSTRTATVTATEVSHLPSNSPWLPTTHIDGTLTSICKDESQSLIWDRPQQQPEPSLKQNSRGSEHDEIGFCAGGASEADVDADMGSVEKQQWSMNEIRKKCQMAGHSTNYANNNNNTGCSGEVESVWGMCAACNSELKSIPANRLLRDELQLEADEIMSDLKYMQDLYIGRADADSETASDTDWSAEDTAEEENDKKSECGFGQDDKMDVQNANVNLFQENCSNMQRGETIDKESTNNGELILRDAVIETVNRFITEWLCPENSVTNNVKEHNEIRENEASDIESNICDKKEYNSNLWHATSNEHNIWQLSEADGSNGNALKPLELLRHFNVKSVESSMLQMNEEKFLSELSWEHENLAKIWQKTPPPNPHNSKINEKKCLSPEKNSFNENPRIGSNIKEDIINRNIQNVQTPINSANTTAFSMNKEISCSATHPTENENKHIQSFFNPLNTAVIPAEKLKVANRKRRHSASQNYFHQPTFTTGALTNNNNNNNNIADLNRCGLKSVSSLEPMVATTTASMIDRDNILSNTMGLQNLLNASLHFSATKKEPGYVSAIYGGEDDSALYEGTQIAFKSGAGEVGEAIDELQKQRAKHTIITCKYHLTSIEPLLGGEEGADNDMFAGATALSCLIDKNASILNHVTMVTRPLTR